VTNSTRDRQRWLRAASLALALAALAWTFRDVRMERVSALLGRLGVLGVLLSLLPQLAGIGLDTLGWRRTFSALGARTQFRGLLWTRFATEALALAMPGGAVVAEPLKVPLLGRHAGLEASTAVAGVVARKYLVLAAQSAWLALSALLALYAFSQSATPASTTMSRCMYVVLLASLALAVAALFLRLGLSRGSLAMRVKRWLMRIPSRALQQKLRCAEARFQQTDGKLELFFSGRMTREARLTFVFGCAWATEALETYLLLRLLGVQLDFGMVAMMEVALTLLRNLTFLIPAGIGVQDLGYALFLRGLGVSEATEISAAFALLKRGKEMLLVVVGLGLLGADANLRGAASAGAAEAPALP
jgi:uncharacterized protein (TIRG00374 family)